MRKAFDSPNKITAITQNITPLLLFYLTIGLLSGTLVGWYIAHTKLSTQHQVLQHQLTAEHQTAQTDLVAQQKALQIQLESTTTQLEETKASLAQTQAHHLQQAQDLASLQTTNQTLTEKLREQKQEVVQLQEKLSIQFRNLANDLLEEKSKKFTDHNKLQLEGLLKPLGERIQEFEKQIVQTNKESIERNVALRTEIRRLNELNVQVTKEAENLAKAIKGDTKTQGNWGEFILESILEKSGLVKDREYLVQDSVVTAEGKRYQPDVVIKLPDGKHLVIDAKVSLVSYERFFNAAPAQDRDLALKGHIQSIRKHIKDLSEKNYQNLYNLQGLDFVLMFIPMEPAFSLAVQHDLRLFNDAYEKNIVIVSPSTLIATLRT
ncbi:MAG: DNA recombination protein RmuC, partial [Bacteroidota bacterium]